MNYKWYNQPQPCPICKKVAIDPNITAELMEAACSPYGYIKCPEHFPEFVDILYGENITRQQPRIYQDEINTWPKWLRYNLRLFMEQHFG